VSGTTEPTETEAEASGGSAAVRRRRRLPVVVVTVAAAAGVAAGGYGIASAASPAPTPSPTGSTGSPTAPSAPDTPSWPGGRGPADRAWNAGVGGRVTAVGTGSITVTPDSGPATTYRVASTTRVHQGPDQTLTVSSLRVGDRVHVTGQSAAASGTPTAADIYVQLPHLAGTVTAVGPDSVTIRDPEGFTRVISTSGGTVYRSDGAAATRSAVKTGARVRAQGRVAADGTTLDASRVQVVTRDAARPGGFMHRGPGGHHGMRGRGGMAGGQAGGPGMAAPDVPSSPSTPSTQPSASSGASSSGV
jgi:hypothetical protein